MANIGYARVSTTDQCLDLQVDALKAAGVTRIYQDKASGATMDRVELQKCLDRLDAGDTLVVWKLDRLGRSTLAVLGLIEALSGRGVKFRSLTEGLDTTGPMGTMILTVIASIGQLERDTIRQRTNAGLASARARGHVGGRPKPKHEAEEAKRATELIAKGISVPDAAKILGVSVATAYRRLQVHREKELEG